jgi:hypothetical protein
MAAPVLAQEQERVISFGHFNNVDHPVQEFPELARIRE